MHSDLLMYVAVVELYTPNRSGSGRGVFHGAARFLLSR
jgi:hypothetical protein